MRLLWLFVAILAAALTWWDWQDSPERTPARAEPQPEQTPGADADLVEVEVVEE